MNVNSFDPFKGRETGHPKSAAATRVEAAAAMSSRASRLKGLVALLLDDWRSTAGLLRRAKIRFHLHCLGPTPAYAAAGPAGAPWKPRILEQRYNPFPALSQLLSMQRLVDIARAEPNAGRWDDPPPEHLGREHWHCAVLLAEELPLLDFQPVQDGRREDHFLVFEKGRLPRHISHAVIVGNRRGDSQIYRVKEATAGKPSEKKGASSDSMQLLRRTVTRGLLESAPQEIDPSFLGLRWEAIDVLIDAMTERLF